jgi:hypothetical protein
MQIHLSASEKLWKRPAVPTAAVLGLLVNPNNPNAEADSGDLQAAAHALGRRLYVLTAAPTMKSRRHSPLPSNRKSVRCLLTSILRLALADEVIQILAYVFYPRANVSRQSMGETCGSIGGR